MKRLTVIVFLLLALGASRRSIAQHDVAHDPMVAKGWTWVASFDFDHFSPVEYGDTLFISGWYGTPDFATRFVRLLSVDGGKTFDTVPFPDTASIFPNLYPGNRKYIATFEGDRPIITLSGNSEMTSKDTVAISTDLGRTYRYYPRPRGWVPDRTDSSVWLDKKKILTTHPIDELFRSTDSGRTWQDYAGCNDCPLPPPPPSYQGITYSFVYDIRQHGLWYVYYTNTAWPNQTEVMYGTTDNGKTFRDMCPAGNPYKVQAGIGFAGELRTNANEFNDIAPWRGYWENPGCLTKFVDWVDSLFPGRPDTFATQYNSFGIPDWGFGDQGRGYAYSLKNPDYLQMAVLQVMTTPWLHERFPDSLWWLYSTNGGKTWTTIRAYDTEFRSNPGGFAMDNSDPNILWAVDSSSLYKRDMRTPLFVEARHLTNERLTFSLDAIAIKVHVPDRTRCVMLFDVLGREQGKVTVLPWQMIVTMPCKHVRGVNFLVATDGNGSIISSAKVALE